MPEKVKSEPPEQSLVLFGQTSQLPPAVQKAIERYGLQVREKAGVAPTWKPEKAGEYIIGEVLSVRQEVGEFKTTAVTIQTPQGAMTVWLGADLKMKMDGAAVGQVYCVTFAGVLTKKDNPKLKNDMKLFNVVEILK